MRPFCMMQTSVSKCAALKRADGQQAASGGTEKLIGTAAAGGRTQQRWVLFLALLYTVRCCPPEPHRYPPTRAAARGRKSYLPTYLA